MEFKRTYNNLVAVATIALGAVSTIATFATVSS